MVKIDRFTLEQHPGPYESWPPRSRLLLDGAPTGISLPGYVLLHQFETPLGYILVTDHDCPFEEFTHFILVSKRLRVLSRRSLGCMYYSYLLQDLEWINDRTFVAVIYEDHRYRFTIRCWSIPFLRPRLKMEYLGKRACAATHKETQGTSSDSS